MHKTAHVNGRTLSLLCTVGKYLEGAVVSTFLQWKRQCSVIYWGGGQQFSTVGKCSGILVIKTNSIQHIIMMSYNYYLEGQSSSLPQWPAEAVTTPCCINWNNLFSMSLENEYGRLPSMGPMFAQYSGQCTHLHCVTFFVNFLQVICNRDTLPSRFAVAQIQHSQTFNLPLLTASAVSRHQWTWSITS